MTPMAKGGRFGSLCSRVANPNTTSGRRSISANVESELGRPCRLAGLTCGLCERRHQTFAAAGHDQCSMRRLEACCAVAYGIGCGWRNCVRQQQVSVADDIMNPEGKVERWSRIVWLAVHHSPMLSPDIGVDQDCGPCSVIKGLSRIWFVVKLMPSLKTVGAGGRPAGLPPRKWSSI